MTDECPCKNADEVSETPTHFVGTLILNGSGNEPSVFETED